MYLNHGMLSYSWLATFPDIRTSCAHLTVGPVSGCFFQMYALPHVPEGFWYINIVWTIVALGMSCCEVEWGWEDSPVLVEQGFWVAASLQDLQKCSLSTSLSCWKLKILFGEHSACNCNLVCKSVVGWKIQIEVGVSLLGEHGGGIRSQCHVWLPLCPWTEWFPWTLPRSWIGLVVWWSSSDGGRPVSGQVVVLAECHSCAFSRRMACGRRRKVPFLPHPSSLVFHHYWDRWLHSAFSVYMCSIQSSMYVLYTTDWV